MSEQNDIHISKFLSLVLRHKPDTIGLNLDEHGWAHTKELIEKSGAGKIKLTLEKLKQIVETNDKKRFIFSPDFKKIRANQGHTIEVDLELKALIPPNELYHGTAEKNIDSIRQNGLVRGKRNHVHLSTDIETAKKVGKRYGNPIVLRINTKKMTKDGNKFYQSENGVWLTEFVLPEYIWF